jgi:hypothetical protein
MRQTDVATLITTVNANSTATAALIAKINASGTTDYATEVQNVLAADAAAQSAIATLGSTNTSVNAA